MISANLPIVKGDAIRLSRFIYTGCQYLIVMNNIRKYKAYISFFHMVKFLSDTSSNVPLVTQTISSAL